ncbi:MAG TPA: replication-relaxation family protein, partial [Chloroflexota bacterium]|nr:replication-relaxation family protein [Chloroflexota bacterium]
MALPTWAEVADVGRQLGSGQWRIISLLSRLPLLWAKPLQALAGLSGPASVYRSLEHLEKVGAVQPLEVPWQAGRTPRLWHLSDLGVAVAASRTGQEPAELAARNKLRRNDFMREVAGLPQLVALYEMLATVAGWAPGAPEMLDWERPWRRAVPDAFGRRHAVRFPAAVQLGWGDRELSCLLLPDDVSVPLRAHRAGLQALVRLRQLSGQEPPPLLIGTSDARRARAWGRLLDEVQVEARGTIQADIIWSGCAPPLDRLVPRQLPSPSRVAPGELRPAQPQEPVSAGVAGTGSPSRLARLGARALDLAPADLVAMDRLARQAFLSVRQLAAFTELSVAETDPRLAQLIERGWVLQLPMEQNNTGEVLFEATLDGLRLAAARLGLSLQAAIRFCHFAGGGHEHPVGSRQGLLDTLDHTYGVNQVLANFVATADVTSQLAGDGLGHWQPEAAASNWELHPDAYGVYVLGEGRYGFFLEFDRGTMNTRDYRTKVDSYYRYRDSGQFTEVYDSFPHVLFVTASDAAEKRFGRVAQAASAGRPPL